MSAAGACRSKLPGLTVCQGPAGCWISLGCSLKSNDSREETAVLRSLLPVSFLHNQSCFQAPYVNIQIPSFFVLYLVPWQRLL